MGLSTFDAFKHLKAKNFQTFANISRKTCSTRHKIVNVTTEFCMDFFENEF